MRQDVILLGVLLLALSGCAGFQSAGLPSFSSSDLGVGQNGLEIQFVQDKPPETSRRDEVLEVELRVRNKGGYDLPAGALVTRFVGTAKAALNPSAEESASSEELLGKDPTGGLSETFVDLGTLEYRPDQMTLEMYEPTIEVELCYPYETEASTQKFLVGDGGYVKGASLSASHNSAAPVIAKDLEERVSRDKIIFTFTVENIGKGRVVDDCWPPSLAEKPNQDEKVTVEVQEPGSITCRTLQGGSGEVSLISKKREVECEYPLERDEGTNFELPLSIALRYHYMEKISKRITIQR